VGERVHGEVVVDASSDVVWEIVTDLTSYPSWTEGLIAVEVLDEDDAGYPVSARFRVDARIAEVTYTLAYTYDETTMRWTLTDGEIITQLDGSYEIVALDDARTRVVYTLEADIDLPLPAMLKRRQARAILEQGLDGLARRAIALR